MIQRIQTVYLFLAAIILALLFLFPFAYSLGENGFPMFVEDSSLLFISTIIGITLAITSIFLYKNRSLQKTLTLILLLVTLFIGGYMIYDYFLGNDYNLRAIKLGQYLPFVSALFAFLARFRIHKDEKEVRSMDRLR